MHTCGEYAKVFIWTKNNTAVFLLFHNNKQHNQKLSISDQHRGMDFKYSHKYNEITLNTTKYLPEQLIQSMIPRLTDAHTGSAATQVQ